MKSKALDRISKLITAEDLMTHAKQLKRADTLINAQYLFNEYDVVPYPKKGRIKGYFHRDNKDINQIETRILVSNGTNVFDLIRLLNKTPFCFVLSKNDIVGYIHFSDLNKSSTKISLFILFEATERKLWEKSKDRIQERDLKKVFKKNEVKVFLKKRNNIIKRNVDIGWTGIFTFPFILRLARFYGSIDLTDNEIKILIETRNKVAHSDRNLVNSYEDIKKIIRAEQICRSLKIA